jgi:RNA polymerase sigma factor (sigma-70 family)
MRLRSPRPWLRYHDRVGVSDTGIGGRPEFPPTHWSAIRHAHDPASADYERHLRALVELYWKPVYWVIRHAWSRGNDEAKDLTQEFFAEVMLERSLSRGYDPERGSFRLFLRTALTRFMSNTVRDAGRQKRGGGQRLLPLDALEGDVLPAPEEGTALTPDEAFDAAWNRTVIDQAVALVERRLTADGKAAVFALWKRYDLEGGAAELSYAALAQAFALSVPQVKNG